ADTVAAPIEQQVNGVPGMLYMSSQMGNDGSYTLLVTFDLGTDLNTAVVMVQNRVQLAIPQLPNPVQSQGITIRKKTPDILMVISFYSPDGRYDDIYLSNFATIHVRDELLRVDGVSDLSVLGQRDYSMRAWLDPQRLAALDVSATEVAAAVRNQNLEAAPGQVVQPPAAGAAPFTRPLSTLGRLSTPEQFGDIIVKVGQSRVAEAAPQTSYLLGKYGLPIPTPSPQGGGGTGTQKTGTPAAPGTGAGSNTAPSGSSGNTGSESS